MTSITICNNHIKIGSDRFSVGSLQEAISCWESARDQNFWGASDAPSCSAIIDGVKYEISYNGRAWDRKGASVL